MNIVLLGPPGAGKGTQAENICAEYRIPRVSTGDLLRKEVAEGSQIGREVRPYMAKGLLVPDRFVTALVEKRVKAGDCINGFLIDGYPRNVEQAVELEKSCKVDVVLYLELGLETALERLAGRVSCPACDSVYHLQFMPPKVEGLCDACSEKLVQREDDKRDTVKKRFETYEKKTMPLLKYFDTEGIVRKIDANRSVEETFEQIRGALEGLTNK